VRGVARTAELQRIADLPRRSPGCSEQLRLELTRALKRDNGTMELWPLQASALIEAADHGGLLAPIDVGGGKALITLLIPVVAQLRRPLLLLPASLKVQTERQVIPQMQEHWHLHPRLTVLSYEMLSRPESTQLLEQLRPDGIILDEAHALKNASATRTKRFLRYMREAPQTKLYALSGTLTSKSLFDFWHLLKLALPGPKCPLPLSWSIVSDWDAAVGAAQNWSTRPPLAAGALQIFCSPGENSRQGVRRRLVETPGVVASDAKTIDTPIVISELRPEVPAVVRAALEDLRRRWVTPWGEEIEDHTALYRHARQLANGFYYRWRWPGGEPDREWLAARSAWHAELRALLKHSRPGRDSPLLATQAVIRGELKAVHWAAWAAVRHRYKPSPPVEAVWLDEYMIDYVQQWLSLHPSGIAWYDEAAVGAKLRERKVNVFGAGRTEALRLLRASGPIACSIPAHHTGKNLQAWCDNLVMSPPSSGKTMQQLIGRTHRSGQRAAQITVQLCLQTPELETALKTALERSEYVSDVTGGAQKLLIARRN
jgi:hypothetical protein